MKASRSPVAMLICSCLRPSRGGDQRALLALGGDLRLHRAQDLGRRRQVLDLVAQHLHAPVLRRLVERVDHRGVDRVALLEGLVELHLADHRAQQRLRQLRDGEDVVARAVAGAHRVGDLEVDDAVDLQLGVVLGDAHLAGHVQRHLLQRMLVGHALDEGDHELQPRRQRAVVLAQPLDHPGVLLRHDLEGLEDEDGGDDRHDDGDFHGAFRRFGAAQRPTGETTSRLPCTATMTCSPGAGAAVAAVLNVPGAAAVADAGRAVAFPGRHLQTSAPMSRLTSRLDSTGAERGALARR